MNLFLKNVFALSSALALFPATLPATSFDSGSDGSDGALVLVSGLGDIVFDPDDFNPILDPDRDGIYHFTTVSIGQGTYVQLRADVLGHKPVIWLASGDVSIEGELNLGAQGQAIPGAGGFMGGDPFGIQDGQGPGGTPASPDSPSEPSADYVNPFLMPLIGASGSGANLFYEQPGFSGGGAMLIASSGTVRVDGFIQAWGSGYTRAGNGNVRIVANEIAGGPGVIQGINVLRMEAFEQNFSGHIGNVGRVVRSAPGAVFPRSPITISFVDGNQPVDQPGANKHTPDVTISNGGTTFIEVRCWQIPLGTTIRVVGWNETVGMVEGFTGPLQGTLDDSSAVCEMVIPPGNTTFMAQAVLDAPAE